MYIDFLRSVGISPVSWIMFKSLVISLMLNSPREVSISEFCTSSSRIWGPSSLLVIGDGPLSSWYNSVMYSDHFLRKSSFFIKMSPSFDRAHPDFLVAFSL